MSTCISFSTIIPLTRGPAQPDDIKDQAQPTSGWAFPFLLRHLLRHLNITIQEARRKSSEECAKNAVFSALFFASLSEERRGYVRTIGDDAVHAHRGEGGHFRRVVNGPGRTATPAAWAASIIGAVTLPRKGCSPPAPQVTA